MDKIKTFFKDYWRIFAVSLGLILFVILSALVHSGATQNFDNSITTGLAGSRTEFFNAVMKIITFFGGTIFMVCACVVILIIVNDKKTAIKMIACIACSALLNFLLKTTFKRTRPLDFMIVNEKGFSFPSGHAMASLTFYGMLIYLAWKSKLKKSAKVSLSVADGVLVALIGFSRIYLGTHYFTDVLAGFIVSTTFLIVYDYILKRFFISKGERENREYEQKQKAKNLGLFVIEFPTAEQKEFMDKFYAEEIENFDSENLENIDENFEDYKIIEKDENLKPKDDLKNEDNN